MDDPLTSINYLLITIYLLFISHIRTITIDDPILGLGVVQDDECGRNEACARHSEFLWLQVGCS